MICFNRFLTQALHSSAFLLHSHFSSFLFLHLYSDFYSFLHSSAFMQFVTPLSPGFGEVFGTWSSAWTWWTSGRSGCEGEERSSQTICTFAKTSLQTSTDHICTGWELGEIFQMVEISPVGREMMKTGCDVQRLPCRQPEQSRQRGHVRRRRERRELQVWRARRARNLPRTLVMFGGK